MSDRSYDSYAACTSAAAQHGYMFIPSQPKIARTPSLKSQERNPGTYTLTERQEALMLSIHPRN